MNANQKEIFNTPEFTQFALREMDPELAAKFREELLKSGVSEDAIDSEIIEIRKFQSRMAAEFSKDEAYRASPNMREEILKSTRQAFGLPRWLIGGLSFGALSIVTLVMIKDPLMNRNNDITKKVFGNAESFADQLGEFEEPDMRKVPQKIVEERVAVKSEAKTQTRHDSKPEIETLNYPAISAGGVPFMKKAKVKGGAPSIAMMDQVGVRREKIIAPSPLPPTDGDAFNREGYDQIKANPYVAVSSEPLSTFSVDVDTASYANIRRFLFRGQLPPKNSVRVEEMINYFPYNYNFDHKDHPVAVKVDQIESPFNKGRRIVRVAFKADAPREMTEAGKNLVFLLDVSGSMNDPKKLPLLKESMKLLMRKLDENDTISIVVYAGAAGVVLEPTPATEKLKILTALDNLSAGGSTNGGAGIKAAYKLAKQGFIKKGVNRVILATDGDFNVGASSHGALLDLIEEKSKDDIFLTVLGLGMGNYQDSLLEKISNRGNGNYAYIDSLNEANKLFNIDLEKNLTTVSKDVKVQVEFNPKFVKAYRLIGYENRMLKAQDFNDDKKDAAEMGAGHTVTALYEIVPPSQEMDLPSVDKLKYGNVVKNRNDSNEILNVKVRYKQPTGSKSTKFEVPLQNVNIDKLTADLDFDFALTVAGFGLKLRGDEMAKDMSYRDLLKRAKASKGKDEFGFRSELIEMIELARQIDK